MFVITKKIDSENITKLCRTCLREDGEKMVCLFVGPAESSLAAKLRSLYCLEIWQGDGLPERMCDRCITRAESALLYREQCRAADKALRQAASKVLGVTPSIGPGFKPYKNNQGFLPINDPQKFIRCLDCGASFSSYQELCVHNRLHVPYTQDRQTPAMQQQQHMHIVESQSYFNLGHFNSIASNEVSTISQAPTRNGLLISEDERLDRAACALHCSLCNHTFTNRMQLISHNLTHSSSNVDSNLSCDSENIDISSDNSNNISREISFDRSSTDNSIQNLSYSRTNDTIQDLTFPEHIDVENPQDLSDSHNANDVSNERVPITADCSLQNQNPKNTESVKKKFKCNLCDKSFSQNSKLKSHKLSHTGERPFKCSECSRSYTTKSKLTAHVKLHTKTDVHTCKVCNKVFSYPSYLEEHLKIHDSSKKSCEALNRKNFECTVCEKRFRLVKNLKAHMKIHTGKGVATCEICDKRFSQKYNLKVHMKMHKNSKTHNCEYCSKSFSQKSNLVEHLRTHTKVKPFECKLCSKKFAQSSHLKNHEATHENLRNHQCRLCGKRFKLSSHLKRHLNLHTGANVYKCEQCNQVYSQAFSLKRHLKRHSENHN